MLLFTTHHQALEPEYVATFVGGMADGLLLLVLPHNIENYSGLLNQRRYPLRHRRLQRIQTKGR